MPDCESSGAGSSGSGCRPRTRRCICCPGRAAGTKSRLREDEGWRTAGGDADSSHHREGLVTERLSLRLQLHLHHEGSAARDLCTTTPSETDRHQEEAVRTNAPATVGTGPAGRRGLQTSSGERTPSSSSLLLLLLSACLHLRRCSSVDHKEPTMNVHLKGSDVSGEAPPTNQIDGGVSQRRTL